MSPRTTKNRTGDNMQTCVTPLPTTKGVERIPLCSTLHLAPLYVDFMTGTYLIGIPPSSQCHPETIYILAVESLQKADANRNGIQHFAR